MTEFSTSSIVIVLILMTLSAGISGAFVQARLDSDWKSECTRRGVGGYNKLTGKWEWITPLLPEVDKPKESETTGTDKA